MTISSPSSANFASYPLRNDCPGCGGAHFENGPILSAQPVMLNYRCATESEARELGKGTVHLRECQGCGLIFNAAFDPSLIRYDTSYDNRQGFSGVFRTHLESVADRLMRFLPAGGSVLEVGCGKGEFLRLLRDRGCARCVGYDTSCPEPGAAEDAGIEYHCSYVTPENIGEPFDLIICRHVVEHVPGIGAFMTSLAGISRAAGHAVLVVETPEFGWIVEHGCFWDYFYEHCNYFTFKNLEILTQNAGLEIISHERVFGDQYQFIVSRPGSNAPSIPTPTGALAHFTAVTSRAQAELETAIGAARQGSRWAIWGAGAKGVTLASRLREPGLELVIDSNPAKAGCRLPGSAIPVVSPEDPRIASLPLILIANPMYEAEIKHTLATAGFAGKTITA